MYFLDKEVCGINHTEKGFLVRIHNKGEAKKHIDMAYPNYTVEDALKKWGVDTRKGVDAGGAER